MMVNYILILILLLLFVGLGTDAGMLEWRYLQLSAAARAGAIGGSIAQQRYTSSGMGAITATGQAATTLNGFTNGTNGVTVAFENPPTTGPYSGNPSNTYSVRCTITQSVPTAFMGLAGFPKVTMSAYYDQPGTAVVSLSSAFNVLAIVKDGNSIPTGANGGFDSGYAYSANALDSVRTTNNLGPLLAWRGNLFSLGPISPAGSNNGVSQATISLTQSKFSQLLMLAGTAWNYTGSKTNTSFVVTYTDGSTATTTFGVMADWCLYTSLYADEVLVAQEAYRDYGAAGTQQASDTCTPHIFGYTINLDNTKTVKTLALPTTGSGDAYARDTIVLAVDLVP